MARPGEYPSASLQLPHKTKRWVHITDEQESSTNDIQVVSLDEN